MCVCVCVCVRTHVYVSVCVSVNNNYCSIIIGTAKLGQHKADTNNSLIGK